MIPKFTHIEFEKAKYNTLLKCQCKHCLKDFKISKKRIKDALNPNLTKSADYCSRKCLSNSRINKSICICVNCKITFEKKPSEVTKNNFCSKSCAATYNNKNKTHGTRRSKLEQWLEEQLTTTFPELEIHYNQKSAISSELDIYIPSLNLAFELNGIFHYEPIYGVNKLNQIKDNDISKSKACHEAKIDLCIIDTSQQTYVKPSTSQKYLDIISNIIKERLSSG